MTRWPDGPLEEAYGRVTNPERYAPVLTAARSLLDRLERDHAVVRTEGRDVDAELVDPSDAHSVVRLQPLDGRAAPLTIAFTAFPSLHVRLGRWHTESFPSCGCDACDDEPAGVVADLEEEVAALVDGRFVEQLTGGWRPVLSHAFVVADGRSSGTSSLDRAEARRLGPPGRHAWAAWPPRDR